ncbi:ABC transporter transmembrane domain-containing protein [Ammonicoccus fulvus]|uniref:ABC transporter transmembrane domain-containing protein n=1 Tax=Ammonicoccus fulvus TaxID=3138240 RepID=A0ABZ3FNR5_9ACTN
MTATVHQVRPGRALWTLLARHRGALALALVLSVGAAGLSLAQPLVVNRIIGSIGQAPIGGLVGWLAVLLVASALFAAAQLYVLARTAESAVLLTRQGLIGRLLRLPVRTYDEHRAGDLVSRLGSDTTKIQSAFNGGLVDAVGGLVVLVGSIVAMALLDGVMLAIVLVVTVIALAAVLITSERIQRLSMATQESVGRLGADLERALSAIRTSGRPTPKAGSRANSPRRPAMPIATASGSLGCRRCWVR